MSSLLQFNGQLSRNRGVGLEMYLEREIEQPELNLPNYRKKIPAEPPIPCEKCGRSHIQLYRVWRKPVGMFGCWVVFRYNGEEHIPDLSCPFGVPTLPRGAEKLSPADNAIAWHKQ
jgi:hypothetical protein